MLSLALVGCLSLFPAQAPQGKAAVQAPSRDTRTAAPTGTGVIAGTVVSADTGRPVRRVRVTLSGTAPDVTASATTADDGHFAFRDLPAATFTLAASRPGFIESTFGQKQPGSGRPGTPIPLGEAQKLDNLSLVLARGGVLAGTVTDEAGEPEFGAQVIAFRWVMRTGERTLIVAASSSTDDRGMYRVPGLLPGDYVVSATSTDRPANDQGDALKKRLAEVSVTGDATAAALQQLKATIASLADPSTAKDPPAGYAPVYFPGTTQAGAAQTITLGVSEEHQAVDFALQLVPLVRVSGIVTGAAGTAGSVQVLLTPTGTPVSLPGPRSSGIGPDGQFSFAGIPPGAYTVLATTGQPGIPAMKMANDKAMAALMAKDPVGPEFSQLWAMSDVVADGRPLAPLVLALGSGLPLGGRLALSGAGTAPDFSRVRVAVIAAISSSPERSAPVPPVLSDATGHFLLTGLVPGRYRLTLSGTGSWAVASAMLGGRDVMDVPLEVKPGEDLTNLVVTLIDRSTGLSGALTDAAGHPAPGYTLVVFTAEPTFWLPQARRIQAVRPGTDGHYAIQGLPPGDYRLAVVPDVEPGQWYDPTWLRSVLPSAIPVTLADGQRLVQDVRVK